MANESDYIKDGEPFKPFLEQRGGKKQLATLKGLTRFDKNEIEAALALQTAELEQAHRILAEKDRLLAIYNRIGRIVLSSLDMDEVLDRLTFQVLEAGLFRSFMVAMIDAPEQTPRIVRPFSRQAAPGTKPEVLRQRSADAVAVKAAFSGAVQIVENVDPLSKEHPQENNRRAQICIYIPIKHSGQVLAVLGTDCLPEERDQLLERINNMGPLFDQIAIALGHAKTNLRLKETRLHLIQADKMASLGQLAAGVAHEINNPVGFVRSNIETLVDYITVFKKILNEYQGLANWIRQHKPEISTELLASIDAIESSQEFDYIRQDIDQLLSESVGGVDQVIEIVQVLKNFVSDDGMELRETDINRSMEETIRIVWNELKYKCQVHKDLADIPSIQSYAGQLKQVFMNLVTNAAHAIHDQGDIWIKTWVDDTHVRICIRDNGSGMAPEVQARIFEPFYTTKLGDQGTGLGLAISYSIIQAHKGHIKVQSIVGKGSEFIVAIPKDL